MRHIDKIQALSILIFGNCGLTACNYLDIKRGSGASAPQNSLEVCDTLGSQTPFPPVHKLNNEQYDQTIKHLLDTRQSFSKSFPVDQTQDGFKTDARAQVTSGLAVEHYLQAATKLSVEFAAEKSAKCEGQNRPAQCFEDELLFIAESAYRRPLAVDEKQRLLSLMRNERSQNAPLRASFETGIKAILVSPQFLFRLNAATQQDDKMAASFRKATRLSYFLWGSLPDVSLRDRAAKGQFAQRESLRTVVKEMLQSDKSDEFVRRFTQQWLQTNNFEGVASSGAIPREILEDMSIETAKYFEFFLRENYSVTKLLTAKFTFPSYRLAEFYNLPRPSYPHGPVRLEGTGRRGLLTQGSFLAMTSHGTSSSPVKRAKWILDHILCSPPGAPPMMAELESSSGKSALTMRERLAQHRENPSCASCHAQMDPIGLSFEAFDYSAKLIEKDKLAALDLSGELVDGTTFKSYEDLISHLRFSKDFPRCLTTKLAVFGLGRPPDGVEKCKIDKIAQRVLDPGYGIHDLVVDVGVEIIGRTE